MFVTNKYGTYFGNA